MIPYTSIQIANWFINKSNQTKSVLTSMKLIKLVYISHGWHLALTQGFPLVSEDVQAWKFGPVFPELYHRIKQYGSGQIDQLIGVPDGGQGGFVTPFIPNNDQETQQLLEKIWQVYGMSDGITLSQLTHAPNTPWSKKWEEMQIKRLTQSAIDQDEILNHYKTLMSSPN